MCTRWAYRTVFIRIILYCKSLLLSNSTRSRRFYKPWSKVPPFSSSVRTFIFSRIGFSISTALQFSSNVANSRFRAFRWSILMQKKVPRSMSARWQKIRCQDQTSQVLCFMLSNNATVRNFAPSETALIGTVFLLFKNILWSERTMIMRRASETSLFSLFFQAKKSLFITGRTSIGCQK